MNIYEKLQRSPSMFVKMTGLRVDEFAALAHDVLPRFAAAEEARLTQRTRQRAYGGGDNPSLTPVEQLLLTVVWLRLYPTQDVPGFLFGVSHPTAGRYLERMLPVLEQAGRDTMRLPDPGRGRRRSLPELVAHIPELAAVVDSFEQAVQRSEQREERDTWFCGKVKRHTVKSQVTVDENTGQVIHSEPSVKGRVADITLLKTSGLLATLPAEVALLADAGYQGMAKLRPSAYSAPKRMRNGPELTEDEKAYDRAFASRRIIVENTIRRLRTFECLSQRDRHHRRLDHHTARVVSVAGLVNRQLTSRFLQ
ncbi:MAG: transposase [Anaerolineae bacterium]|nr:transposase [Anaerolineae bacterium]